MPDFTPHQKKIIDRYYDHRDQIMTDKLSELVTEIYLADSDKKRDRLWERAAIAMQNLKWKPATIDRLVSQRKPEALAAALQEWMGGSGGSGAK